MPVRTPLGIAARATRLVAGASLLVALLSLPALAAPANVGGMTYDEKQRRITIGLAGTVSVRTQRIKHPDRLVIDLSEARLPVGQPVPIIQPQSSRIRSIRMGQNSYVPPVVRVVVDLMPGFEPMVTINQSSGKLLITLANPAPPQGERDLESLPGFPPPGSRTEPSFVPPPDAPVPEIVTRLPAPTASPMNPPSRPTPTRTPAPVAPSSAPPRPQWAPPPAPAVPVPAVPAPPVSAPPASVPAASPTGSPPVVLIPDEVRPPAPRPTPTPLAPAESFSPWAPQPLPSAPPTSRPYPAPSGEASAGAEDAESDEAESILPPERQPSQGHGSIFQLRWQQVETLEEYGGPAPSFAYPAGINGFDLEHWFMPYVGAGLDARVLFYDLTVETVRQHRTDATLGSYLAVRYPFGILEPSLRAGYMGRTVTVESETTGTTFPFSPLQTYYGPTLTGRLKVSLLPGFGLDLHGKLLPGTQGSLYPGFPGIFPLSGQGWGASLVTDVYRGYVSLGYTAENLASADGSFKQTFSGITLGAGMRY